MNSWLLVAATCGLNTFVQLKVCSFGNLPGHYPEEVYVGARAILLGSVSDPPDAPDGCSALSVAGHRLYVRGTPAEITEKTLLALRFLQRCEEDSRP